MVSLILFLEAQSRHSSQGEFFSRLVVVSGSSPHQILACFGALSACHFAFAWLFRPSELTNQINPVLASFPPRFIWQRLPVMDAMLIACFFPVVVRNSASRLELQPSHPRRFAQSRSLRNHLA
jgi:hypothetical protein